MLFSWETKIIPFQLKQTVLQIWVRTCDDSITYCNGTYLELPSKQQTRLQLKPAHAWTTMLRFFVLLLLLFYSLWLRIVFQSKHLLSHTFTQSIPICFSSASSHFDCMQMCSTCDSIHLAFQIIQIRPTTLELRWNDFFLWRISNEVIRWN